MSYSFDLKSSFFNKKIKKCCLKSLICGMLIFLPDNGGKIRISSEYEDLLEYYNFLFSEIISYKFDIMKNGKLRYIELSESDSEKICKRVGFSYSHIEEVFDSFAEKHCCFSSFLRGVFFTVGSVASPETGYRLEFRVHNKENAEFLMRILERKNIFMKCSVRKNKPILYTRSADTVKDFLAEIGAVDFMFDYANTSIEKKLRNDVNRHLNCDNANIDRAVASAINSVTAINFLEKNGYFENLSEDLKEIAILRKEDTAETLAQIGEKCNPPISKASVFRKLKKVCEIAEKYKNKKDL